jgi:uncharacterized RDD family membrane protein YckC
MAEPHDDDRARLPRLPPAPLGPRILAGCIDAAAVLGLGLVLFLVPFLAGAESLPVVSMLVALVTYSVLPLALFRSTLGMRLLGIELIGRDGRPADLLELLFREIIGRGMGPAAYLGSFVLALVGAMLGHVALGRLGATAAIGFWVSGIALLGAAAGHLIALSQQDRRTLADLVCKTMVVPRAVNAVETSADAEELAARADAARARIRNLVLVEALLLGATLAVPLAMAHYNSGASKRTYVNHLRLETLQKRFARNPGDDAAARELIQLQREAGQLQQASKTSELNTAAHQTELATREQSLRQRLAEDPRDADATEALLELLEDQHRLPEARGVVQASYLAAPSPDAQGSYGAWLYDHAFSKDAIVELQQAIDGGCAAADAQVYLGYALLDQGDKIAARQALHRALELDPDADAAREKLELLEAEIGPEPVLPKAKTRHAKH